MGLRGKELKLAAVKPSTTSKFEYGFRTDAIRADLGHVLLDGTTAPVANTAVSPKNIKPARASKRSAAATDNSFVDVAQVTTAKAAGYKIQRQNGRQFTDGIRSRVVAVKIAPNLYHGWSMDLLTFNLLGASGRTALGIILASAVPAGELAFNSQGYVLTVPTLGIGANQYISRSKFRMTYDGLNGTDAYSVRTYVGIDAPFRTS